MQTKEPLANCETTVCLYPLDGPQILEDAPAGFAFDVDEGWGRAQLVWVRFNNIYLERDDLLLMFGATAIDDAECAASEHFMDLYANGELAA